MRLFFYSLLFLSVCIFSFPAVYADTIFLKDGSSLQGKVVEDGPEQIKIDIQGVVLTYYRDEIEKMYISSAEDASIAVKGHSETGSSLPSLDSSPEALKAKYDKAVIGPDQEWLLRPETKQLMGEGKGLANVPDIHGQEHALPGTDNERAALIGEIETVTRTKAGLQEKITQQIQARGGLAAGEQKMLNDSVSKIVDDSYKNLSTGELRELVNFSRTEKGRVQSQMLNEGFDRLLSAGADKEKLKEEAARLGDSKK